MNAISPGSKVRVVDFTPTYWRVEEEEYDKAERNLIACYSGKIGTVVRVDNDKTPYIIEFSASVGVPIHRMRFYADEVEDIG